MMSPAPIGKLAIRLKPIEPAQESLTGRVAILPMSILSQHESIHSIYRSPLHLYTNKSVTTIHKNPYNCVISTAEL